jgi:hypothetical protein
MSQQKFRVKADLKKGLAISQIWSPIPIGWFQSWKVYVDFDEEYGPSTPPRPDDMLLALHPGPIDTNPLHGSYGDEVKRGLLENRNYVLLPDDTFKHLAATYGLHGPNLARAVRNKGTGTRPVLYVDVYPVRFEMFVCKATERGNPNLNPNPKPPAGTAGNHPAINNPLFTTTTATPPSSPRTNVPTPTTTATTAVATFATATAATSTSANVYIKPDKVCYYPSSFSLTDFTGEMRKSLGLNEYSSTRCWVRVSASAYAAACAIATGPESVNSYSYTYSTSGTSTSTSTSTSVGNGATDRDNNNNNSDNRDGSDNRDSSDSDNSSGSVKRARTADPLGRLLTSDLTDLVGSPWRLLRARFTDSLTAQDLLAVSAGEGEEGECECVRILVEHHHVRMIQVCGVGVVAAYCNYGL